MLEACTQVTPVRQEARNVTFLTVAILAQGTHWATAAKQASCPGSIPAFVFRAIKLSSCKPAFRERGAQILLLLGLLAARLLAGQACLLPCCPTGLACRFVACLLAGLARFTLGVLACQPAGGGLACLLAGWAGFCLRACLPARLLRGLLVVVVAATIFRGSFAEASRKPC